MTEELERKLRALIDRQEIQDLLLRYAHGLDRKDADQVRAYPPPATAATSATSAPVTPRRPRGD